MPSTVTPDALVHSFLKAAADESIAVLVIYGFKEGKKPVMRMASNSSSQGAKAAMSYVDDRTIEAIARAEHGHGDLSSGAAREPAEGSPCTLCGLALPWDGLGPMHRARHEAMAVLALAAVRGIGPVPSGPEPV